MAFLSLLNSHTWTSLPEPPTASTEFTGKSGDVLLAAMPDHLIFLYLTRRWHQPDDNRLCILQNVASTNGDSLTSWPPAFLFSMSSHPMTWSVHFRIKKGTSTVSIVGKVKNAAFDVNNQLTLNTNHEKIILTKWTAPSWRKGIILAHIRKGS